MAKTSKLHESDIANFFTRVTHFGAATENVAILMRWMEWDKQTAGFWADVHERFVNALQEDERKEGWRLHSIQNLSCITLICMDPEDFPPEKRWCIPVKELAERPSPGRRKQPPVVAED